MKSVLITGGSGAFGTAFAKHLLGVSPTIPQRIAIFSRGEHRQAEMRRELPDENDRLRFFIGDVRDQDRLRRAMEGIEVVVHAAALKRIEVGAYNPLEVKKTNIDGAANVIEAAKDAKVSRVVALSTDKAFEPISPYGTSKAFAESLFLAANNSTGWGGPRFAVVRYGNVWGSTGSVVPTWRKIIRERLDQDIDADLTVPVTDPECTRFFMTMQQAVDLVFDTALHMIGGETIIPDLPAYRLGDLAEAMGAKMEVRGLPSYEKLHESMGPGNSSDKARRMTVDELKAVLND
jgi:UDP-N-acetylglucosamine 4,6-dehydratase/5-epimerase